VIFLFLSFLSYAVLLEVRQQAEEQTRLSGLGGEKFKTADLFTSVASGPISSDVFTKPSKFKTDLIKMLANFETRLACMTHGNQRIMLQTINRDMGVIYRKVADLELCMQQIAKVTFHSHDIFVMFFRKCMVFFS